MDGKSELCEMVKNMRMNGKDRPEKSVVARCKKCERVIFAAVMESETLAECQSDMAELLANGYDLTSVTHDIVRAEFGCSCEPDQQSLGI